MKIETKYFRFNVQKEFMKKKSCAYKKNMHIIHYPNRKGGNNEKLIYLRKI